MSTILSQNTASIQTYFEIWQQTLDQLKLEMTRATFDNLLSGAKLVGVEDDFYIIETGNNMAIDWLEKRLKAPITRTLANVVGQPVQIRFVPTESVYYPPINHLDDANPPEKPNAEFEGVYLDKRNAILQPNRVEVHTQYFRLRWRPLLGPLLSELIRELRQRCFFARGKSNDTSRNSFKTTYKELARSLGVSEPTIKRALARNRDGSFKNIYLGYFIKEMTTLKESDGRGSIRNLGTRFTIFLDEPLTPTDETRLTKGSK